ncbi:uncharacterized protein TM35_000091750 [Trypanosoma theileri]|uniref:Uncharacterized protein n=1 Tax=Trypanosoma theileri TaxID=67003 RepID=A0A1X0NZL6_9TRYP|nr:uncharacterized protein TM35_000091750 [Trypanosoma theileri]ORC90125.1 hypothetical protein TM35_000091750 [Trypanosoma theileri]
MITGHDIQLIRKEITSVASTSQRCMVVYPLGKKSRQRVGIGEKTGAVTVFSLGKTMERVLAFETPPQNRPVSCATIYEDQIFFVHGSVLDAYSRKGKLFFSFDTNVTEVIHTVFVSTPFIITCGSFMVTGFREAKELGFYMAPDRINAMVAFISTTALTISRDERAFADYCYILGCNDRTLRMLRSHKPVVEVQCKAPVSSLYFSEASHKVYYGTSAGSLGCMDVRNNDFSLSRDFSYIPDDRQAAVTALSVFDINMDKREELLVGRQDGSVQVFYIHRENEISSGQVVCIWSGNADESVLSIAGGFITHANRPDVLVHSFSGRITAFSLKEGDRITGGGDAASVPTTAAVDSEENKIEIQINDIRGEIAALKQAIVAKTNELAERTGTKGTGTSLLAVSSTFTVKVTLSQQKDSPALLLMIESDTPIDCATIQSEVQLHFVETSSAEVVVQEEIPQNNPLTKTLAIVRPLESRKYSCSATFWMPDGQWGLLKITILGALAPRTAQVKFVQLRPLPLYAHVGGNDKDSSTTGLATSTMEVGGDFTAREMHGWLLMLLSGTPELYQSKVSTLRFENTFTHDTLEVKYADGNTVFTATSLLTLTVIKRYISSCAVDRSLALTFRFSIHDDAVNSNLQCISPRLANCNKTFKDLRLLEALHELHGNQQGDNNLLSEDNKELLEKADKSKQEHAQTSLMRDYLQMSLLALYDSVSDLVPETPKMTVTTKEALIAVSENSDSSDMQDELEQVFVCKR